jgi:hypothetical protein
VNGYLRASEGGEIQQAVCKIWLGTRVSTDFTEKDGLLDNFTDWPPGKYTWHSDDYRRQMTTECILRSLGLTGSLPDGVRSSLAKNEKPKDIGRFPDLTNIDIELMKRHYRKED